MIKKKLSYSLLLLPLFVTTIYASQFDTQRGFDKYSAHHQEMSYMNTQSVDQTMRTLFPTVEKIALQHFDPEQSNLTFNWNNNIP